MSLARTCVAASGLSETYAPEEMAEARELANEIGAEYVLLQTMELTDRRYADNTHQRCFFCKQELYGRLSEFAAERGMAAVIDGSNADDLDDFRPGLRAARDLGVRSPLQEVGLTKDEIRAAVGGVLGCARPTSRPLPAFRHGSPMATRSRSRSCSRWRRPSPASANLGFRGFRLRHHGNVARLEFLEQRPRSRLCRTAGHHPAPSRTRATGS